MSQSIGLRKIKDDNTLSIVLVEGSVSQVLKTKQGSNQTLNFCFCSRILMHLRKMITSKHRGSGMQETQSENSRQFYSKHFSIKIQGTRFLFNFQKKYFVLRRQSHRANHDDDPGKLVKSIFPVDEVSHSVNR